MIEINWKNSKEQEPECKVTEHNKYSEVECPQCLVSDGSSVWEEMYDPSEGFHDSIVRFIELKNITP